MCNVCLQPAPEGGRVSVFLDWSEKSYDFYEESTRWNTKLSFSILRVFLLQPDIALQASPFRKSKIEACLYLCVFLIDQTASTNFC